MFSFKKRPPPPVATPRPLRLHTGSGDEADTLCRLPRKKEWFAVVLPFICCSICLFLLNCQSDEPVFFPQTKEWNMDDAYAEVHISRTGQTVIERQSSGFKHEEGYAMCVGDESSMISDALFTIHRFRSSWKSTYPITVAHCAELSNANIRIIINAHNDAIQEAQLLDALGNPPELHIADLCQGALAVKKRRLRSWFCKTAALVTSTYRHTMLIDTDLIWFQNPDLLFTAPGYKKTGALFFRDRFIGQPTDVEGAGWALQFQPTVDLINKQRATTTSNSLGNVLSEDSDVAAKQSYNLAYNDGNGVNMFWRFGYDPKLDGGLAHNQESSVVILDKQRNHRTVAELRRLIPTFNLGYGDKEIYWIAAVIAGDSHAWEPFLQGLYGDCGEILHFNPYVTLPMAILVKSSDPTRKFDPLPYFMNGQFLVEGVSAIGNGIKQDYTKPVSADIKAKLRDCSCEAMGGCRSDGIELMNEVIQLQQAFMLEHTGQPPSKVTNRLRKLIKRIYNKLLPSWLNR